MKLVIDGDSILYRVAFRGEELSTIDAVDSSEIEEDDGLGDIASEIDNDYAYSGDYKLHLPSSYSAIDYSLEEILSAWTLEFLSDDRQIDEIEVHMSGREGRLHCDNLDSNFRFYYVSDYKSNRGKSRAPAGLPELWAYIFSKTEVDGVPCKVYVANGCEADDTVVYMKKTYPDEVVIAALDKDVLYQSVGRHYNYGKKEFVDVDELEAKKYLYYQMIVGDSSDGYKGVPGKGKVAANKALKGLTTEKQMWDATLKLYKGAGLGLGDMLSTAIIASMHQVVSIEYDGVKIIPMIEKFRIVK